jgi:hypothetical protein
MSFLEHIQATIDPPWIRAGRPHADLSPLGLPRYPRSRRGDLPPLTRRVPTVEIIAGAILGVTVGALCGLARLSPTDVAWGIFFGSLFGLLTGWLIGLFTGATGTLSYHTVLTGMVHILWVLTVVFCFVGVIGLVAALAAEAFGPRRLD